MSTYATQTPVIHWMFSQPVTEQGSFIYRDLTLTFTFMPESQQVLIESDKPRTSFVTHAHSDLCVWSNEGWYVWDMDTLETYLFMWVLAKKREFNYDLSEMIKVWTGKDTNHA